MPNLPSGTVAFLFTDIEVIFGSNNGYMFHIMKTMERFPSKFV